MNHPRLSLAALALGLVGLAAQDPVAVPVAQTADPEARSGVFRFELRDEETGQLIPGRLTFMGAGGPHAKLFPEVGAQPDELAVRKNVVYTKSGSGAVTVPAGNYVVYASRGIEWSMTAIELELQEGLTHSWTAELRHEVDTTGQVSGDFHLHTLTHSGHGDSNMEERILSLIGEGVEFAVATDHNHNIDYGPTVEALGVDELLGHAVGNEVSTPVGHFNVFPLDPEQPPVGAGMTDADELFTLLRQQTNPQGIRPVIQLNHPRWGDIDYFGKTNLDPVTARPGAETFSFDFDTIELLNENPGWGYYDAEISDQYIGSSEHHLLQDWFNLLNRGHRYAGVGNSDSHTVHDAFAGYPRNYVPNLASHPGLIDVADVAAALRKGQVFTTTGPFVDFTIDGYRMGGMVKSRRELRGKAVTAEVMVHVKIQAASWIDCDRMLLIVNGHVRRHLDVPENGKVLRLDHTFPLYLEHDAWVTVIVEGDDPMLPVTANRRRDVKPLAICNPIRVDVDGNGWTAPIDTAKAALAEARSVQRLKSWGPDTGLDTMMQAAAEMDSNLIPGLIHKAINSWERRPLLTAARCMERKRDPQYLPILEEAWPRTYEDPYARLALLRALAACGAEDLGERTVDLMVQAGDRLGVYADELEPLLEGQQALNWMVAGPFDPEQDALEPAVDPALDWDPDQVFPESSGAAASWIPGRARSSGYLDLRGLHEGSGREAERAVNYAQAWVFAPATGEYRIAFGSDDGIKLWVGEALFEDPEDQGAEPFKHIVKAQLASGWNRVLARVENSGGGHGLYFRVLHDGVIARAVPR